MAPACGGFCELGSTCTAVGGSCDCYCGNVKCNICQVCNNVGGYRICQRQPSLECADHNDCTANSNGRECLSAPYFNDINECVCGCRGNSSCPSGRACDANENICKVIPPGGCVNDRQCGVCEQRDVEKGLCVVGINEGSTCSPNKPCPSSECRDCKCACTDTFPLCNGWVPPGKVCQTNASNTGCILVDFTCNDGNTLTPPACNGNCPMNRTCISDSMQPCFCGTLRDIRARGLDVDCELASAPVCIAGICYELYEECRSYMKNAGAI